MKIYIAGSNVSKQTGEYTYDEGDPRLTEPHVSVWEKNYLVLSMSIKSALRLATDPVVKFTDEYGTTTEINLKHYLEIVRLLTKSRKFLESYKDCPDDVMEIREKLIIE